MIKANCRDRFTAADFDFVVRILGRSRRDAVSLSELLTDMESRDVILDHKTLVEAVLSHEAHLSISPQFYFYVLTRHVLNDAGISDRRVTDYIASLLETFSRTARMKSPADSEGSPMQYVSDMLLALRNASPMQTFLIRAHAGNYSLFLSGIFHESVNRRAQRGAPDVGFYEDMGRMNYKVVANHSVARSCELSEIYDALADRFHEIRLALNRLSDELISLDENIPLLG